MFFLESGLLSSKKLDLSSFEIENTTVEKRLKKEKDPAVLSRNLSTLQTGVSWKKRICTSANAEGAPVRPTYRARRMAGARG